MKLRDYQQDIFDQVTSSTRNDLVQLDTGAGKTPIEAALAQTGNVLLVAHRNVLIVQISEKLAAFGLEHDTVSTEYTRRRCSAAHQQHGRDYIVRGHRTRLVASIDSLIARQKRGLLDIATDEKWLIIIDEAHHVVPDNKWGKLKTLFPNSRIVGFTATPARMDNESLHIDNGGVFDNLIQAEKLKNDSVHRLIELGYLSKFTVYAPPRGTRIKFNLRREAEGLAATLWGDPVKWYKKLANGKKAVMMCPSITNAQEFAAEFRAAGIPATHISSRQSYTDISRALDALRSGQVKVLCNVDMVSEGFDLPDIEVMILARRTGSLIAYRQWVGRALRPAPGKQEAIIIDHVNNVAKHDMPDAPIEWDLLNPPRQTRVVRHVACTNCGVYFPLKERYCPNCEKINPAFVKSPDTFYYVHLHRLDTALIERAKREYAEAQTRKRYETEIIWGKEHTGNDIVSQTILKLKKWFVEVLQENAISVSEINDFLTTETVKDTGFWVNHFTAADLKSRRAEKVMKVYRKWQKSLS